MLKAAEVYETSDCQLTSLRLLRPDSDEDRVRTMILSTGATLPCRSSLG